MFIKFSYLITLKSEFSWLLSGILIYSTKSSTSVAYSPGSFDISEEAEKKTVERLFRLTKPWCCDWVGWMNSEGMKWNLNYVMDNCSIISFFPFAPLTPYTGSRTPNFWRIAPFFHVRYTNLFSNLLITIFQICEGWLRLSLFIFL